MSSFSRAWLPLLLLAGCPASGPSVVGDDDGPGPDVDAAVPDGGRVELDGGGTTADAEPGSPDATPPDANAAPQVYQVCASGAPYTTIGAALAIVSAGDTIEVCAGTYNERLVIDNVAITLTGLGGATSTIIDGGGAGTVITVRNATGTGVLIQGFSIQNGYTSELGGGVFCEDSTLTLLNNRITASEAVMGGGGLAALECDLEVNATQFDHNEGGLNGGGAIVMNSTGSIHHGWLLDNTAREGAGLTSFEGSVTIEYNLITHNTARQRGGAMNHISDAPITANAVIENYSLWVGGGIVVPGHMPLVQYNEVRGNTAVNDGGGFYFDNSQATVRANLVKANVSGDDGGGIRSFESALLIEGNTVENNRAEDGGGGIRISHVPCLVVDNIVRNNYAGGTGGGMDLDNDASTVRGGEITGNEAGGSGGGIFTWLAPFSGTKLENIKIMNNRAWKGGGIRVRWNYKPLVMKGLTITGNHAGLGGGIMTESTNYTLTDSIISGNKAGIGAGFYHAFSQPFDDTLCGTGAPHMPCPPTQGTGTVSFTVFHANIGAGAALSVAEAGLIVTSSIFTGHAGAAVEVVQPAPTPPTEPPTAPTPPTPPPTFEYNDVFPATFVGMASPIGSDGNIEANPEFMGAPTDFHLAAGSSCEDAGDPQYPDDDGSQPDMGLIGGAP